MQISQRSLFVGLVLALALAGCTLVPTSKVGEGQACTDDGRCASGYVCNRVKNACIKDDGSGCPDVDNDGVTTCEADCDDTNPTCTTDCTDADSDDICVTNDCDDNEPLCAADCVTDSDSDDVVDCLDTCVDADGDHIGTGINGNTGSDCWSTLVIDSDDEDSTKCADSDADGCDDCVSGEFDWRDDGDDADEDGLCDAGDTCVDVDEDGVGNGHLDNSGCVIPDTDTNDGDQNTCADTDHDTCDDCANGSWDPSSDGDDNDSDGVCNAGDPAVGNPNRCGDWDGDSCDDCSEAGHWDPANDGTDEDGDGFCLNGSSGDCDDHAATCIEDCVTDVDEDDIPDCRDGCLDFDGDGAGREGGAGNSCTGPDCKDNDKACTTDCTDCPPAQLVLTTENVAVCETSNMSVDLDELTGAADQLSCHSPTINLNGPVPFDDDEWDIWTDRTDQVTLRAWADFPDWTCDTTGKFVHFLNNGAYQRMQLSTPFDATGWQNVSIKFDVQYNSEPPAGEDLKVAHCCGPDCTLEPGGGVVVPNGRDGGGTDDCRSVAIHLPEAGGCEQLMVRLEFKSTAGLDGGEVGIDNVTLSGDLMFTEIIETSIPGEYETTAMSCWGQTVSVTCTWDDGINEPESDSEPIVFYY